MNIICDLDIPNLKLCNLLERIDLLVEICNNCAKVIQLTWFLSSTTSIALSPTNGCHQPLLCLDPFLLKDHALSMLFSCRNESSSPTIIITINYRNANRGRCFHSQLELKYSSLHQVCFVTHLIQKLQKNVSPSAI